MSIQPPKYGLITNDTWAMRAIFSWVTGSSYTTIPEVIKPIKKFLQDNELSESSFEPYLEQYGIVTVKRIKELFR